MKQAIHSAETATETAGAADAIGEDFRDEHPCHRRQRHGVAADGRQREHQHGSPFSSQRSRPGRSACATAAMPAQPNSISRGRPQRSTVRQGDEGERQVDHAGDDDEQQDRVHAKTGLFEDVLGVIEQHVDAAPLLQHGQRAADRAGSGPSAAPAVRRSARGRFPRRPGWP